MSLLFCIASSADKANGKSLSLSVNRLRSLVGMPQN